MKTLKIITILSLVQFIAFTSFGVESASLSSRDKASLVQMRALNLLHPAEFASVAGSSTQEARMILSSIVNDTVSSDVSYKYLDKRVEALLNAVHYTKKTASVDLYPEIAVLKNTRFKANLRRVLKKMESENKIKAAEIKLHLKTKTVI